MAIWVTRKPGNTIVVISRMPWLALALPFGVIIVLFILAAVEPGGAADNFYRNIVGYDWISWPSLLAVIIIWQGVAADRTIIDIDAGVARHRSDWPWPSQANRIPVIDVESVRVTRILGQRHLDLEWPHGSINLGSGFNWDGHVDAAGREIADFLSVPYAEDRT